MKVPTMPKKTDYECDSLEEVDQIAYQSPFVAIFIFLKGLLCSNANMEHFVCQLFADSPSLLKKDSFQCLCYDNVLDTCPFNSSCIFLT